jgi:hypothetical protein
MLHRNIRNGFTNHLNMRETKNNRDGDLNGRDINDDIVDDIEAGDENGDPENNRDTDQLIPQIAKPHVTNMLRKRSSAGDLPDV